jgi:predicted nuclease with TOPRIM domain
MSDLLGQLQARLTELKAEFEMGKKMLDEFETKEARLKETLLRISGAIQLLEELIAKNTTQTDI